MYMWHRSSYSEIIIECIIIPIYQDSVSSPGCLFVPRGIHCGKVVLLFQRPTSFKPTNVHMTIS